MKIDLTSTVYLLAAVQASLMIFVILRKQNVLFSEKYLVAVLVALALTLVSYVGILNQIFPDSIARLFVSISAIAWLSVSPLLYLYCRSLIGLERKWEWRNLLYFPFSLYLFVQIFLVLFGVYYGFWLLFEDGNSYSIFWILSYLVNSFIFSLLSIRVLVKAKLSEKHRSRINWLLLWMKIFSGILFCLILLLLYWGNANYFYENFEYILLVFYAVFVFSLILFSLRFSHYFSMMSNDNYRHTQRNDGVLEEYAKKIEDYLISAKPYRQSDFKLKDLSDAINISENELSQVFTQYHKSGFYQIINRHRLVEFENQLAEKGVENYTIMALAELSGFASKATFYKVFKEKYGKTPGAFVKERKELNK